MNNKQTYLHFDVKWYQIDDSNKISIKSRDYFANKGPSSQSYAFSSSHVWMWETIKKAERQRIDAFELWC